MWVHDGILKCCWGQEAILWNQATRPLASFVIWTGSEPVYLLVSLSLMWRDDHLCLLDLLWGLNRLVHGKHLKQYQVYISSVQFSLSVVSDSLRPHELQHARPPCLLPTPGVYSNSWPLSQWCHPIISSPVIPFSSCLQSFSASGSFPVTQFFTSGGQSIGVSALASFLPKNTQGWSPSEWTGWISLHSKGLNNCGLLQQHSSKASILRLSALFMV